MLARGVLKSIAISLTICLLLLGGLAYPQTVAHAKHHAHHTATTHASVLCSWMCSAGQVFEAATIVIQSDRTPVGVASRIVVHEPVSPVLPAAFSRGPPSLSV